MYLACCNVYILVCFVFIKFVVDFAILKLKVCYRVVCVLGDLVLNLIKYYLAKLKNEERRANLLVHLFDYCNILYLTLKFVLNCFYSATNIKTFYEQSMQWLLCRNCSLCQILSTVACAAFDAEHLIKVG